MIDRLGRNITYLRISVTDKCIQKDMVITDIRLLSKTGGVHGDYKREE